MSAVHSTAFTESRRYDLSLISQAAGRKMYNPSPTEVRRVVTVPLKVR